MSVSPSRKSAPKSGESWGSEISRPIPRIKTRPIVIIFFVLDSVRWSFNFIVGILLHKAVAHQIKCSGFCAGSCSFVCIE